MGVLHSTRLRCCAGGKYWAVCWAVPAKVGGCASARSPLRNSIVKILKKVAKRTRRNNFITTETYVQFRCYQSVLALSRLNGLTDSMGFTGQQQQGQRIQSHSAYPQECNWNHFK